MSIWLLILAGLVAWTVVSVAFGLTLGRIITARKRRGGYITGSHSSAPAAYAINELNATAEHPDFSYLGGDQAA